MGRSTLACTLVMPVWDALLGEAHVKQVALDHLPNVKLEDIANACDSGVIDDDTLFEKVLVCARQAADVVAVGLLEGDTFGWELFTDESGDFTKDTPVYPYMVAALREMVGDAITTMFSRVPHWEQSDDTYVFTYTLESWGDSDEPLDAMLLLSELEILRDAFMAGRGEPHRHPLYVLAHNMFVAELQKSGTSPGMFIGQADLALYGAKVLYGLRQMELFPKDSVPIGAAVHGILSAAKYGYGHQRGEGDWDLGPEHDFRTPDTDRSADIIETALLYLTPQST